jgi:FdrA protein
MIVKGYIKKGEYYDSITLMSAVKQLNTLTGVHDSAIVMGTKENKSILDASGLMLDEFKASGDNDLLIVVKTDTVSQAEQALSSVGTILQSVRKRSHSGSAPMPRSLSAAQKILPGANIALISVAGRYAGDVAMSALEHGLHVMLFSDNVLLEQEIALKRYAVDHHLLVMGPDCGTAIVNGVPLAFANVVNRGDIGIVAAAGTGLQEVSCLVSQGGCGVSQALGTGGRDVKKEVGGLMFIESLQLLAEDPKTKIILLVSKPPHAEVLNKIGELAKKIPKPVIGAFLGVEKKTLRQYGMHPANSLEEAAQLAITLSNDGRLKDGTSRLEKDHKLIKTRARQEAKKLDKEQKYIRGLFSGGTFCYEAQLLLSDMKDRMYSNAPTGRSVKLEHSLKSQKHTLIDLGEDEFTVGRPHPMIDYTLRNNRIVEEASDPETAVILLDLVLGYGSNPEPLKDILPAIKQAQQSAKKRNRHIAIVCSVTGTDADPQNRSIVAKGLEEAGVIVMKSNAAASLFAGGIIAQLK